MLNTPENSYVITTWLERCTCGRAHRYYLISDSLSAAEIGINLHAQMKAEWPFQTDPTQHFISTDLLDGFLLGEIEP